MSEEIDIPKVPLSRTEQYLTKIVKELSGSDEEVEIPKTTLSRVEMYLKAIIDLLAEAAVKKPITVKGMVNSKDELEGIENPQVGDMYFVKIGDKSEEFIYNTEGEWDPVGDTSVDLSDYLTADDIRDPLTTKFGEVDGEISQLQDDYAEVEETYVKEKELLYPYTDNHNKYLAPFNGNHIMDHPGLVQLASANSCGISCNGSDESGQLYLFDGGNAEIDKESSKTIALHPNNIPRMFSNYGITSKTYLSETYMTIAEGSNSFVHKNDLAGERKFGVVALGSAAGGITSGYGNVLCINHPTDNEITDNKVNLQTTALTLDRIPAVFEHYGMPSSGFINAMYMAVSSNTINLYKKLDSTVAESTYAKKTDFDTLKNDITTNVSELDEEVYTINSTVTGHTAKITTINENLDLCVKESEIPSIMNEYGLSGKSENPTTIDDIQVHLSAVDIRSLNNKEGVQSLFEHRLQVMTLTNRETDVDGLIAPVQYGFSETKIVLGGRVRPQDDITYGVIVIPCSQWSQTPVGYDHVLLAKILNANDMTPLVKKTLNTVDLYYIDLLDELPSV